MKNNIAHTTEVGFSIAEILGEATEEPAEANEVQEKLVDAWSSIYYPLPYFSGTIYECWSVNMKIFLHARGLWSFVEDGVKKLQDEEKDAFALYYFQQALDDNIFYEFAEADTAREAQESLKRKFDVRGNYMAESQPVNILVDKFAEVAEDS